jgi:hypothetical protein
MPEYQARATLTARKEPKTMQPFLEEKREEIAELCRAHHVRRLAVFGSAARNDFDLAHSDVDLLVEFDDIRRGYYDNKNSLVDALESLFQRNVDLLTREDILNPFFLRTVEHQEQFLYAA